MPQDTVNWNNNFWDSTTIEIRTDHYIGNPTKNPVVTTVTLARGGKHTEVSNGDGFYWIRLYPSSINYVHRPCYGNGDTYEEEIT